MNTSSKRSRGRPRIHPLYEGPKRKVGRPRKDGQDPHRHPKKERISRGPTPDQIYDLVNTLIAAGEYKPGVYQFRNWLRAKAEADLFFFAKWIYYEAADERQKLGKIHRELCRFITDYSQTRRKLLLMPMGHLKTNFCSKALPLHVLIQRPESNIYFPGKWGCDQRILLGNESEEKCKENLSVVRQHLENNVWIAWLWPHVCWENPTRDSPCWQELKIIVPRTASVRHSEASVTAIGALTGVLGRHYDFEALDDIAGTKASESWQVMLKVKKFKKTARSRLNSQTDSIEIGLGTHQCADDVYVDWQNDPSVETMIRAIEEEHIDDAGNKVMAPLWPENPDYSLEKIEKMRLEMADPVLWAHWYLNRPVASGFTAMDWATLREFRWDTQPGWMSVCIEFDENEVDHQLNVRKVNATASPLLRFAQGMPLARARGRAMKIHRAFGGQSKPSEDFLDHMRTKYACGFCTDEDGNPHRNHVGMPCPVEGCDCRQSREDRPWETILKGPI